MRSRGVTVSSAFKCTLNSGFVFQGNQHILHLMNIAWCLELNYRLSWRQNVCRNLSFKHLVFENFIFQLTAELYRVSFFAGGCNSLSSHHVVCTVDACNLFYIAWWNEVRLQWNLRKISTRLYSGLHGYYVVIKLQELCFSLCRWWWWRFVAGLFRRWRWG